ncbi:acetyltransferase [Flavobacterium crassostreae]|uniref:Acetyltransferase n=1 Tax=Flavobacterium crassostreae TaxID=1763534 RepID=A0A1B9E3P8_9FLAO|nr:acetyltransferase [Flavobacterium crassostreae]OCB76561.1 acetyltransferase [Flavobacterium crassostreae]
MYLFGASGHCKVIIDIIENENKQKIDAILDDNPKNNTLVNSNVIKPDSVKFKATDSLFIAIGNNYIRKKISQLYKLKSPVLTHPKAIVASSVKIGEGTVIMAGSIINPDVIINKHCIINTGAIVEHDSVLESFVHISPNASIAGNVEIKEGTHVGIGSCVIQGVKIGKWVTIGAGAVITKNIPDYAVVVGNPGRIIKYNKEYE